MSILLVKEFHEKFGVPLRSKPGQLALDEYLFRQRFMAEELGEFAEAYLRGDLVKQADALVDLQYVLLGTALMMGIEPRTWHDLFAAVHLANMRKRRASELGIDGRHEYDVRKPPGWEPPEPRLREILARAGEDA